MSAETTKEIMTGIPVTLSTVWLRTKRQNRSKGLIRAWQLAKRQPEFWTKCGLHHASDGECKTTRLRLPAQVHEYVMTNKADIAVPVAHTVSALLYLAFTDLSNALYDAEYANSIDQDSDNNTQAA